jgi:hypothetical protein
MRKFQWSRGFQWSWIFHCIRCFELLHRGMWFVTDALCACRFSFGADSLLAGGAITTLKRENAGPSIAGKAGGALSPPATAPAPWLRLAFGFVFVSLLGFMRCVPFFGVWRVSLRLGSRA